MALTGLKMAPAPGSKDRARYYQDALYAVSTIDETVIPIYFHTVVLPPPARKPEVIEQKMPTWNTAASFLTRELGEGPFLFGKTFGAMDVIVGYDMVLAQEAGLLPNAGPPGGDDEASGTTEGSG